MTEKEKFFEWFNAQVELGMINFKPWFNLEGIAEHFGATVKRREGMENNPFAIDAIPSITTHYVDFGQNHPGQDAVDDFIYGELNKVVEAMKNGVPVTFYDSHTPESRLRSLARVLEEAARDGKTQVSVSNPKQAAEDLYELVGGGDSLPWERPKVNVHEFVKQFDD